LWEKFGEKMEMQTREALASYKQSIMEDSGGGSEDCNTHKNVDRKDCAHEVSDGNKALLRIGLRITCVTLTPKKKTKQKPFYVLSIP
jgi:hypothetical protein